MGRAIVREPVAFLMDEPLSNLDAKLRVQTRTQIARLQDRLETTTVYVTHDQTEAMTLGDRIALMRRGVVQQLGSPRELYEEPVNLFVAGFIGSPAMNFLRGEIDGSRIKLPMLETDLPSGVVGKNKGTVIAGIRPENFEDASLVPQEDLGHGAKFKATIEVIEWMGSELFAYFTVGGAAVSELGRHADLTAEEVRADEEERTTVVARLNAASQAKEGEETELWLDARTMHLFDPDSGLNLCLGDDDAPDAAPADTVATQPSPAAEPAPTPASAPTGGSSES